jgi:hypothetical protein
MYVGEKDSSEGADFLARNGLSNGKLYTWVPDDDIADTPTFIDEAGEAIDPDDAPDPFGFNGTGNSESGSWVELDYYRPDLADTAVDTNDDGDIQDEMGYDSMGFATQAQQDQLFIDAGGFQFSRPEDVATNPEDGTVAVMASTGRDNRFPEDSWGTTYEIATEFDESGNPLTAQLDILYDGDDAGAGQFESPDFGLRSPDNLDWADDGHIYINEDRSIDDFGLTSGEEASIWQLDPETGALTRVAQMDRSAVPEGQTDAEPEDIGAWESSGILDVSTLFGDEPGTRFIFDVQAHSLEDGIIASEGLVEGGQLAFLTKEEITFEEVFGTAEADTIEVTGTNQIVFAGDGNDLIDLSTGAGDNRTYAGSGADIVLLGSNDRVFGDSGDDRFFATSGGGNSINGNAGADQFWIATAAIPETANLINDFTPGEDVIGIAGLGISFDDLTFTDTDLGAVVSLEANDLAVFTNANADFISNEEFFVLV